ncbi:MAG TPA: HNH endonuclease, partial [Planctomycetota bacterium]|nr:HNH endonuclease [Planctomycetota bacterium]
MGEHDLDLRVRLAAFEFLERATRIHGDVLPAAVLRDGFEFEGGRVHLQGPEGIFKPAILPEIPLSILTAPPVEGRPAPYEDRIEEAGVIRYKYRGTDPDHPDNRGLRKAMDRQIPLVYL